MSRAYFTMLGPSYLICVKYLLCLQSICKLPISYLVLHVGEGHVALMPWTSGFASQLPRRNVLTIVPCLTHKCSEMSNMFSYVIVLFSRPPFNHINKISYVTFMNLPQGSNTFSYHFPQEKSKTSQKQNWLDLLIMSSWICLISPYLMD
jgi:hypothetical protein